MSDSYRYGDYQRKLGHGFDELSFNALNPKLEYDSQGHLIPYQPPPIQLTPGEIYKLLRPYVSIRFIEQVKSVIPLGLYLALFQVLILRQLVENSWVIISGLFAVIVGLMFFMEGLKLGLMPFGTVIGKRLPEKSPLPLVLLEPAIGALKVAGQNVAVEHAAYLYELLNNWSEALVLVIGFSVGLAAVIGTLRFLYGWSLKPLIYGSLAPVLILTLYGASDPDLTNILGLAWDAGAVTTGPVTVPLVLALGIGIAAAAGKGDSGLSGFGIVTLASLFPIIGVLLLAIYVASTVTPAEIIAAAHHGSQAVQAALPAWYERSPGMEIVLGVRAILPLVLFLFVVLRLILKETLHNMGEIVYGIGLTIIGMCIFNLGLTFGLSQLGGNVGSLVPAAFMALSNVPISPIYVYSVGLILSLAFAWGLGFGATVAEPALNALGTTAENLTNGVFKKKTLIMAVSLGVAIGIATGLAKLIFNLPLVWLILVGYLLAFVLTIFSSEAFVNVAWDSAGVTTGPITVPLVLAMGLGFGNATHAVEGFGILSMASIGPILTVLITGLWADYKAKAQARAAIEARADSQVQEVQAVL
jgi:hypothetical protein